jgi:hypothetical protein
VWKKLCYGTKTEILAFADRLAEANSQTDCSVYSNSSL